MHCFFISTCSAVSCSSVSTELQQSLHDVRATSSFLGFVWFLCHITFALIRLWADSHVNKWRAGGWRSSGAPWTVAFPKLQSRSSECGSVVTKLICVETTGRQMFEWRGGTQSKFLTINQVLSFLRHASASCQISKSCAKTFSDCLWLLFQLENCLDGIQPNSSY